MHHKQAIAVGVSDRPANVRVAEVTSSCFYTSTTNVNSPELGRGYSTLLTLTLLLSSRLLNRYEILLKTCIHKIHKHKK